MISPIVYFWAIVLWFYAVGIGNYLGMPESMRKAIMAESEENHGASTGLAILILLIAGVIATLTTP